MASASTPSSSIPPAPGPGMVWVLPSRLHYIASSENISDPSVPMRVGHLCGFFPVTTAAGEKGWLGMTTSQISSPRWQGMSSPPVFDESPEVLKGRIAWEVEVKKPVKSDFTTDRSEVMPTGRQVGTVVGVGSGGNCYVKVEKWFTESEKFKMGRWAQIATEAPEAGERVYMEVAR